MLREIFVVWCCTIALRVLSLHKRKDGNSPLRIGNFALSLLAAWFFFAAYVTAGWSTCTSATSRACARKSKLSGAPGLQLSPSVPLRAGLRSGAIRGPTSTRALRQVLSATPETIPWDEAPRYSKASRRWRR